jgi:hypothetical protein
MTRENQTIEWKETWRDEYLRWVSGFANGQCVFPLRGDRVLGPGD